MVIDDDIDNILQHFLTKSTSWYCHWNTAHIACIDDIFQRSGDITMIVNMVYTGEIYNPQKVLYSQ